MAEVRDTLDSVAQRRYLAGNTLPVNLLKAIAYQESGWQSTIVSCAGAIGTMQVLPGTADWLNAQVSTETYDVYSLRGNVSLGALYLAWLTAYFGDRWFGGSRDLTNETLLNAVIGAYYAGQGSVVNQSTNTISIPSSVWPYVNNVRALMTNCSCLSW